jgi:hypothetical protein
MRGDGNSRPGRRFSRRPPVKPEAKYEPPLLTSSAEAKAMKSARELLKSGRGSEAKYEPPLIPVYAEATASQGRWEEVSLRLANQKRARRRESESENQQLVS